MHRKFKNTLWQNEGVSVAKNEKKRKKDETKRVLDCQIFSEQKGLWAIGTF